MITKKNNIKKFKISKKKIRTKKIKMKGGSPSETDINKKISNIQEIFKEKHRLFGKKEEYEKARMMYSLINVNRGKQVVNKNGKIEEVKIDGEKLPESPVKPASIEENFKLRMNELENQEKEINAKTKNFSNLQNTGIYLVNFHGSYNNLDSEFLKVPKNTYVCFFSMLDVVSYPYPYGFFNREKITPDMPVNTFYTRFNNMNSEAFNNIVKFRGLLSRNTKGSYGYNESMIFPDLRYNTLDCFENSTWYYPGQGINDINLTIKHSDLTDYFLLNTDKSIIKYSLQDNKITVKNDEDLEGIKEKMIKDEIKEYRTKISKLFQDITLKNGEEEYKIILIRCCRLLNSNESFSKIHIQYESLIHSINLNIQQGQTEDTPKNCDMECIYNISNDFNFENPTFQGIKSSLIDEYPEYSRFTPYLMTIDKNIGKLFEVTDFSEILRKIGDMKSDLMYISVMSLNMILQYFKKVLNDIVLIDSQQDKQDQKILIFKTLMINFLKFSGKSFHRRFLYFTKTKQNLFKSISDSVDLPAKFNEYLDFYCFMHCIIRISNLTSDIDIPKFLINDPYHSKSDVSDIFQIEIDSLFEKDGIRIINSLENMEEITKSYGPESGVIYSLISGRKNIIQMINYLSKDSTRKIRFQDITEIPDNYIQETFPNLKELDLVKCSIDISNNKFLNLVTLDINNCSLVQGKIKLSDMPYLKKVSLVFLNAIEEINIDLQNLENLIIENCYNEGIKINIKQSFANEMIIKILNIKKILELNLSDMFIHELRIINSTLCSCPALEDLIIPINEIYLDFVELKFNLDFVELVDEEETLSKITLKNCKLNQINMYNLIEKLLKEKIDDTYIFFELIVDYSYNYSGKQINNEEINKLIKSIGNVDYYNKYFKYRIETQIE